MLPLNVMSLVARWHLIPCPAANQSGSGSATSGPATLGVSTCPVSSGFLSWFFFKEIDCVQQLNMYNRVSRLRWGGFPRP